MWENFVSEVAADYVQLADYASIDFEEYLKGYAACICAALAPHTRAHTGTAPRITHAPQGLLCVCRRQQEITALNGLGKKTRPYKDATAKNNAFIAQRRCSARELLRSAHEANLLPYRETVDTHTEYVGTGSMSDVIGGDEGL